MSATLRGKGVVFSIGAITYTGGIASGASADNLPQSARLNRSSEKTEIKDNGGTIRAVVFHGFKKVLSLTIIPDHATSAAGAKASMVTYNVAPGTAVSIVNADGSTFDASYNVVSSIQNRTVDGVATLDLELEAGDEGIDLTTAVS